MSSKPATQQRLFISSLAFKNRQSLADRLATRKPSTGFEKMQPPSHLRATIVHVFIYRIRAREGAPVPTRSRKDVQLVRGSPYRPWQNGLIRVTQFPSLSARSVSPA